MPNYRARLGWTQLSTAKRSTPTAGGQGGLATGHGHIDRVGGRDLRDEGLGGSVRRSARELGPSPVLGGRLGSCSVLESEYEATVHRLEFGLCRSIIGGSYPRIAIVN